MRDYGQRWLEAQCSSEPPRSIVAA